MVGKSNMSKLLVVPICIWMLIVLTVSSNTRQRTVNYEYFDEYLLSVALPPPNPDRTPQQESETPSEPKDTSLDPSDRVTDTDILGYFRDVPRRHWSCCMLGKLAGDKGFQCQATFYAARIARRNINRAHNRKMLFHGPDAIRNWGRDLMTTFSRCINRHEVEFHKCCHVAVLEQTERKRWQEFRRHYEEL